MSKNYMQDKLFTSFAQEDQLAPGTGLGLSIIHQIIKHLGGKIEVRSRKTVANHGTDVTVTIPMVHSTQPDSVPRLSDTTDLLSILEITKNMDICLSTFETASTMTGQVDGAGARVDNYEMSTLASLCESWYQMRVSSDTDSLKIPDLYLIIENEANHESLRTGALFSKIQQRAGAGHILRFIVMSRTPSSTNALERSLGATGNQKIVEFVCQPCGPRKLGKTLLRCFTRSTEIKSSVSQPTPNDYPFPIPTNQLTPQSSEHSTNTPPPLTAPKPPAESQDEISYSLASPLDAPTRAAPTRVAPSNDSGPFLLVDDNHINLQVRLMFHSLWFRSMLKITLTRFYKCS
jgi:hypothetical protein